MVSKTKTREKVENIDVVNKMKNLKSKRGFTLVEILIVIAIIGILASIALIGLGGSRVKARDAKRIAEVKQIQTALELYLNRCGFYPGPSNCAGGFSAQSSPSWAQVVAALQSDTSVTNVPSKDPSGNDYLYATDGQSYVIGARLEQDNAILQNQTVDPAGLSPAIDCSHDNTSKFNYCVHS